MTIFYSFSAEKEIANEPDSAYIFAYASDVNGGRNGLHFAWSIDKENWHSIGQEYSFLKCDYSRWGSEKRMVDPFLFHAPDGTWYCAWTLNDNVKAFAYTSSKDLTYWKSQSYPVVDTDKNCKQMQVEYDNYSKQYSISWISDNDKGSVISYKMQTKNFKDFTPAQKVLQDNLSNDRVILNFLGKDQTGTVHKVSWATIDNLIETQQLAMYKTKLYRETTKDDSVRFASLKPVEVNITADGLASKKISDMLIGIFFEDINYAADGGLYAELVQNRGFEYQVSDKQGRDKNWNSTYSWSLRGEKATFTIDTVMPIHPNNKHYAVLNIEVQGAALVNSGFDGIPVKAGEKYDFSVFARTLGDNKGKLIIRLTGKNGEIYGEAITKNISSKWKKYEVRLLVKQTADDAQLEVIPDKIGTVALDMVSLFPQKTFKYRKNGLRTDLAQTLADMNPRFIRFPGGCVAHGDGLENMYRWKNTIGPLETRKPQRNIWNYHQTAGLGYYEYFQFCEDLGAEPVPILPAGVPCQNSGVGSCGLGGQQGGIPISEMGEYIQEVLDLIEWANGDAKTTVWGKKRAEAGHPKPFNLKYIGVGNEDLISDVFEERFTMIFNAVKEKHPEITVIGTAGPFYEGTDYVEGWRIATELGVPMLDEHYYNPPGWFIHNQDFYDRYDRSKAKVYLGEYAAHLPGRPNNMETALAEALYLTSLERNGDIVSMTSYAPLLAKDKHTQWNPDLIYFNNTEVRPTVGYYVQQLYGQNSGNEYLNSKTDFSDNQDAVIKRVASSIVRDNTTGDIIIKLVNILPVEVQTKIKLDNIKIADPIASMTVLTGSSPSDRKAKPFVSTCEVSNDFVHKLPAYSFTVIRIKGK